MFIIAGLGNPGKEYLENRHNIGFMAIDCIHSSHTFSPWRTKFHSKISEGHLDGIKTILVKPQTFMNLSGKALVEIIRFYKLSLCDCTVIHDELDLKAGQFRVKIGGGDAGHNGLKSITKTCGRDYKRLRIGIGRPLAQEDVAQYVLSNFTSEEKIWLEQMLESIALHIPLLAKNQDTLFVERVFRLQK
ncbi:aminoacyl-tRNA hydrolase [Liberibacter sp. Z1]|nr:aminoacyl-tRNA hydrolase [Candidatus Liberibacter sp.]MBA5724445.1 aminoacyl-tRNA hydrolase [Candidatus Liberibacter sp.]